MILRTRHSKPQLCTLQKKTFVKNLSNGTLPMAQKVSKENRSRSTTSVWKVRVELPEEYPFSSPSSAFTTQILPFKSSIPSKILYQKYRENMQSTLVSKKFSGPSSSSGDMNE